MTALTVSVALCSQRCASLLRGGREGSDRQRHGKIDDGQTGTGKERDTEKREGNRQSETERNMID